MKSNSKLLCGMIVVIAGWVGSVAAEEPIRIGVITEITGPQAEIGRGAVNGIKLAQEEINRSGGILGRQVELLIEDTQSTNPGTVLAFSKLLSVGNVTAILGPTRSTQLQAASPTIAKSGIPTMIGGTDTALTRVNNRWIFRARPNDSYAVRVIADFGVNSMKLRKWAIVHSTDTYGAGGSKALIDALKTLGVEPVLVQSYTPNSADFSAVVLAVKNSGADILCTYMTPGADIAIFATQQKQLGSRITWLGSSSIMALASLKLAGDALYGTYAVSDFAPEANEVTSAFSRRYRSRYDMDPDIPTAWSYDALQLLGIAINRANSTEPEAIRQALLTIKGYRGLEGEYEFDERGDGLHGYSVLRNEGGKMTFIKRVDFPAR
jgi:branched-chain amino acid transport system substrate-binding protein